MLFLPQVRFNEDNAKCLFPGGRKTVRVSLKPISDYLILTICTRSLVCCRWRGKAAARDSPQLVDHPWRSLMLTLVPLSPKAPLTLAGENWGPQPWGAGRVLKGPAGVWDKGGGQACHCQAGGSGSKEKFSTSALSPSLRVCKSFSVRGSGK